MKILAAIFVLFIYCLFPLPIQLIVFIGDVAMTGWGVDEVLLIIAIILRRVAKG